MLYITALILGFLISLIQPRGKFIQFVITLILISIMAMLMGGVSSMHSFDTSAYEWMYSFSPDTHRFEWGYIHLSYWAFTHGIPYMTFRLISYSLFLSFLYIAVRRFTPNTVMFFSLFMVFPFFVEASQVRNFFMFALVMLGSSFLTERKVWPYITGIIIIASGSLFQTSGLIYILIPVLCFFSMSTLLRISLYLLPTFALFALLSHYFLSNTLLASILSLITKVSGRSDSGSIVSLYSQGSSFSRVILYILAFALIYLLVVYGRAKENVTHVNIEKEKVLFSIMMIGIFAIPAMAGSADFERFLRNGICAAIVIFSMRSFEKNGNIFKRLTLIPVTIIVFALTTTAWRYWDTSDTGRYQYLPYISQVKKDQ